MEFSQLGPKEHRRVAPPDAEEIYRSIVLPGFSRRVAWLGQEPLPPVPHGFAELGLVVPPAR